ncbi:hypothetical protein OpiT1DRAFT_01943 [Opitutaceae bacterium TAV1]|nr:hypothetical protein OpiT1DRAFT_01943 [Opitutaceae bacterium TAV1]
MCASEKRKHVALFGCYKYGKFGDDLMGYIFGKALTRAGYAVRVYGLPESAAAKAGLSRTDNLSKLVDNASCVVIGGGGFFLAGDNRGARADLDKDLDMLLDLCEKASLPVYSFSVGGNNSQPEQLPAARRRLLQMARFISFRNPEERAIIESAAASAVASDIVWTVSSLFPLPPPVKKKPLVGVDRSTITGLRQRLMLLMLRLVRLSTGRSFDIVYLDQHVPRSDRRDKNTLYYEDLEGFIEKINTVDLILTHRLHLGMTGMSYGIPVVPLYPTIKAALVFSRLHLDRLCIRSLRDCIRLACSLRKPDWPQRLKSIFREGKTGDIARQAEAHLAWMLERVASHAGPASPR